MTNPSTTQQVVEKLDRDVPTQSQASGRGHHGDRAAHTPGSWQKVCAYGCASPCRFCAGLAGKDEISRGECIESLRAVWAKEQPEGIVALRAQRDALAAVLRDLLRSADRVPLDAQPPTLFGYMARARATLAKVQP